MKCSQCGKDNNLQDRTGNSGRCTQCNHPFAFEPTQMDYKAQFTDPFFAKAIADISAENTLYFTPKQFVYFIDRRLKQKGSVGPSQLGCLYISLAFFFTAFFGVALFIFIVSGDFLSRIISFTVFPIVFTIYNIVWIIWFCWRLSRSDVRRQEHRYLVKGLQLVGAIMALPGAIYGFIAGSIAIYWIAALIGGAAFWLGFFQGRRIEKIPETFRVTAAQVQGWLDRWAQVNGAIPQLLPHEPAQLAPATVEEPAPDVTAYSFDRVVVCQNDAIAHMLIANNFHFENNCAILSITGYPQNIFDTTMQMLRRNPELKVFSLHDCQASGVAMAHQLRTNPKWFGEQDVTIVDVGLLPRQVISTDRGLFMQQNSSAAQVARTLEPAVKQGLTPEEREWLEAGYFVELESFSPQRLIRILNYSIAQSRELEIGGAEASGSDLLMMGDDTGSGYLYTSESFG